MNPFVVELLEYDQPGELIHAWFVRSEREALTRFSLWADYKSLEDMLENAEEIREDEPGYGIRARRMTPAPPEIRALAGGRPGASYFFDYWVGADGCRSIVVEDYDDRRVVTGITIEPSTDCWPWQ